MEDAISQAKRWTAGTGGMFLKKIEATPDDKLNWTPSTTCRSVLAITAHVALANKGLAMSIGGNAPANMPDIQTVMKMQQPEVDAVKTREQALQMFHESLAELNKALDTVKPDALDTPANTPFGPIPLGRLIFIPDAHMSGHAGQIDYIQTVYGDMELYF